MQQLMSSQSRHILFHLSIANSHDTDFYPTARSYVVVSLLTDSSPPRGEQQAAAIEANLASIESKLDALLASVEAGAGAVKVDGIEDDSKKEQPPQEK
ncbi:hypothetical protein E0Z10_g8124 [Xylaria hypoxylon]|uniref:Uncharacterized protein n=1 Tax=Xylaria hypoxylon TaxID=37992 RepID=A0A4Z0YKJ6_9PEZI|nr:hypothetical protein E0Z10_g8124 [Xylaria hypoxylon]